MLSAYVVFGLFAARVASHDPNFAIEPDYYRKAVGWDSTLAESRRSALLGWRLRPALGAIDAGTGALLTFELRDSAGAPVGGATIAVEARQVAHADDVLRATLTGRADGAYSAQLPLTRPGLWELRVVATRGTDRFAANVRLDASATAPATVIDERPGDPLAARLKAGTRREETPPDAKPRAQ